MISTPLNVQHGAIKFLEKALDTKGDGSVAVVKQSKKPLNIRLKFSGDIEKLKKALEPIVDIDYERVPVNISGKYPTYAFTLNEEIAGVAPKGSQFYVVHAAKIGGLVSGGDFNPAALGLDNKTISKQDFVKVVTDSLGKARGKEPPLKTFLQELLEASGQGGKLTYKPDDLLKSDVDAITKDFGEVCSAYWFMSTHPEVKAIRFAGPSEKLVDFYAIFKDGREQAVSVKAKKGGGAAPSLKAIEEKVKSLKYSDSKTEDARETLLSLFRPGGVIENNFQMAKRMNTPGYKWIAKFLGTSAPTVKKIDEKLKTFKGANPQKTAEAIEKAIAPFFKLIGRSIGKPHEGSKAIQNSIKEVIERPPVVGYAGLLLSPLQYHIADEMNKRPEFLKVLQDAARSTGATQVYSNISMSAGRIDFSEKEMDVGEYEFKGQAKPKKPNDKNISFKMKK